MIETDNMSQSRESFLDKIIPSLIYHMPIRQLNKLWEMLAITLEFQFYLSLFLNLLDTEFFVSWNP